MNLLDSGLSYGKYSINALAYCDDILLISNSLGHLQKLLKICESFGVKWKLKFNPNKCTVMNAAEKLSKNIQIKLILNNSIIPVVKTTRYLCMNLLDDDDIEKRMINQFTDVRKSFFSLYKHGMKPIGLQPLTKSKLYNSFCIPKATYGIGLEPLNEQLLRKLEIMQNNILRGTLGLHKTAKMSALKRTLGIDKIKELHIKFQLVVLKLIPRHPITQATYDFFQNKEYSKTYSFHLRNTIINLINSECEEPIAALHQKLSTALVERQTSESNELIVEQLKKIIHNYSAKKNP